MTLKTSQKIVYPLALAGSLFMGIACSDLSQTGENEDVASSSQSTIAGDSANFATSRLGTDYVSLWKGENNGDDATGNNNGSVLGNTSFTTGKVGQAFSFEATASIVKIPDDSSLDISGSMSISAWFKTKNTANRSRVIVNKGGSGAGYQLQVLGPNNQCSNISACNGAVVITFEASSGQKTTVNSSTFSSSLSYNDNQWHHAIGMFDVNTGKSQLYVDGQFIGEASNSITSIGASASPLLIGAKQLNSDRQFEGAIDEVAIYNRLLNAAEIGSFSLWKGENNAEDSSGVNNGVLKGNTSFVTGKVGQAFSLSGTGDIVEIPDDESLNTTDSMTISAWFKTDNTNNINRTILNKGGSGAGYRLKVIGPNNQCSNISACNGAVVINFEADSGQTATVNSSVFPSSLQYNDDLWHHVVGMFDADTGKSQLYVDGVFIGESSNSITDVGTSTLPLLIGAKDSSGDRQFKGAIDEVAIYPGTLSAAEISALYP